MPAIYFLLYYIIGALTIYLISKLISLPRELIRKMFHILASFSIFILLEVYLSWWNAFLTTFFFYGSVHVGSKLLIYLGKLKEIHIARKEGSIEISNQIANIGITKCILILVFWGILGPQGKLYIVLGFITWGIGDATAALIGKFWGINRIKNILFDPKKTLEGSLSMAASSFLTLVIIFIFYGQTSILYAVINAFIIAPFGTIVEGMSKKGSDTITLPVSISAFSYILFLFYQMGFV